VSPDPVDHLAPGVLRVLAPNPGPMTLDGTNTYLLDRSDGAVAVDPGPLDEAHLTRVAALRPITAVVLTHHHPDHSDGVARLIELTGAQVLDAHAVPDGEPLAATGLRVLRTPGHTADSVCLVHDGGVLTGDTVLGRGSTVVAWPDGDLAAYLTSLERLQQLGDLPVLPGHGPVLPSVRAAAAAYLAHRRARLDQVRAAIDAGDRTAEQVVARVYADVDRALWPAATWQVRAQLAYLGHDPGAATNPSGDRS